LVIGFDPLPAAALPDFAFVFAARCSARAMQAAVIDLLIWAQSYPEIDRIASILNEQRRNNAGAVRVQVPGNRI
jgi:hypothetical protein